MSKIQELLYNRNEKIDVYQILGQFSWMIKENQKCILSPDSDGLLCGLLMTNYLNWEVVGYYDGKILLLHNDYSPSDCIFLDMEIYRKNIRSIGHHMLNYNKNLDCIDNEKFSNCIQPNLIRNYDGLHDFRLKYPLATIHLIISILYHEIKIELPETAIAPLFFTDGTFNVLFKYPENVLNWLDFLRVTETNNPLNNIFCDNNYNTYELMLEMNKFFRKRDEISIQNERGDRLRISEKDGNPMNCEKSINNLYSLNETAVNRIIMFIKILSEFTCFEFKDALWQWDNFKLSRFQKRDFKGDQLRLNGTTFCDMLEKEPLSWAMTSGDNIEYTLKISDDIN